MSITKSVEDLLKPRVKVTADYPESPFRIGDILEHDGEPDECWILNRTGRKYINLETSTYPAIFKKLEWWEEREPEQLPEYVKPVNPKEYLRQFGEVVLQVNRELSGPYTFHATNLFQLASMPWEEWLPATESEYLNYINTTPPQGGE